MAKKKLSEEQEKEVQMLLMNNEMLEKTKKEAEQKGNKTSVKQIERAQQEVIEHINSIDSSLLTKKPNDGKKVVKQANLFNDETSIFDLLNESSNNRVSKTEKEEETSIAESSSENGDNEIDFTPNDNVVIDDTVFNTSTDLAYDVIQLPSNGQPYKNKVDRVSVAYLTAYDENIITSPNLYKDGIVIDYLLKNKIIGGEINAEDLVSGDADAITLYLRATSYGADFPIVVNDPDTGEQIETTVDLTTLKPKEFNLIADENGHFEYVTPVKKDKIKFRFLTRKQERQLKKVTELEGYGTKAHMLDRERESLLGALVNDKCLSENEKKVIRTACSTMDKWSKKLKEMNSSEYVKIMTNSLQLQIVAVNGNYDREFIRKYINAMPARDSMMLRKYIGDNKPGIDFTIEVERPESLGGGSFETFLNWDDSVFLNIPDV